MPMKYGSSAARTRRLLSVLLLLLSFWAFPFSSTLRVGLQLEPNPSGHVTCLWQSRSGKQTTLGTCSAAGGRVAFDIPVYAETFSFVFHPSGTPCRLKAISCLGMPVLSADWLLTNAATTEPVSDDFFLPKGTPLTLAASDKPLRLEYRRLFPMFLKVIPLARKLAAFLLLMSACVAAAWPAIKRLPQRLPRIDCSRVLQSPGNRLFLPCAIACTCLLALPPPVYPIATGLDPSWQWVFNHLALKPDWIGTRMIFTYGPLGFLLWPHPVGINPFVALASNLAYIAVWCASLLYLFRQGARAALWCLCSWVLLSQFSREWNWSLLIVLLLNICCQTAGIKPRALCGFAFLAGMLGMFGALMKFTIALLVLLTSSVSFCYLALFEKKRLLPFFAAFTGGLLLTALAARLLLFQDTPAAVNWIRDSWEIASGYNRSMVWPVSPAEVLLPLGYTLSVVAVLLFSRGFSFKRLVRLALILPPLFFSYKYSVTRGGFWNICVLLWVAPFLTATLALFADERWRPRVCKVYLAQFLLALVSVVPIWLIDDIGVMRRTRLGNLAATVSLGTSIRSAAARSAANLQAMRLPQDWLDRIGDDTFQPFPTELTYAPANNLNFVPMYACQMYSAYTARLDAKCAELYGSPDAPSYMMLAFDSVDRRNPMLDTPAVWNAIRRHYALVAHNETHMLLNRQHARDIPPLAETARAEAKPGEWIDLPDGENGHLSVEWQPSTLGRLMSLAIQNTVSSVTVEYADGTTTCYRLIPDTLRTPFPVRFIPRGFSELLRVFTAPETLARPLRMKLDCEQRGYYSPVMRLRFYSRETAPSPPLR